MLAIERRNAILSKLYLDGKVIVSELSQEFDVTEETIRRDLEKLDREGLVKKSYGGAVLVQNFSTDLPHSVRKKANVEAKQKIAEKITLNECLKSLSEKDREIITLRYFKGETQTVVAKKLGMTQVQVSRREKVILKEMRLKMVV